MDIETSGAVKLFFPNPSLPLVYFEALANSLDAGATEVMIDIDIDSFDSPSTLRVIVSDNGSGFNEDNFLRFKTLLKPRDKYHKGIGRLVFLNYFDQIQVKSSWGENYREFIFKEGFDGVAPISKLEKSQRNTTTLEFFDFVKERIKSYRDIKPDSLKEKIIEHFLPTFDQLRRDGVNFSISLNLKTKEKNEQKEFFDSEVAITQKDLPEFKRVKINDASIDPFASIDMLYHIRQTTEKGSCLTAFNVDGRTIPINLISSSALPPKYACTFIFESEIFHSISDSSRRNCALPEGVSEKALYDRLKYEVGVILEKYIPQIKEKNKNTRSDLENQFPHLYGYFENNTIGLINKDEALTLAQDKFFSSEKEILQSESLNDRTYKKSLELSSRVLTEYVLYREKIIRRMKSMTFENSESEIHNLIVPRYQVYKTGVDSGVYQNNAWLLDDKFMVFRTILSEKRMEEVVREISLESDLVDKGRPDIAMIFSADPYDEASVDVVVVEIKKKTDSEKENQFAINQLLDRAEKLVAHCKKHSAYLVLCSFECKRYLGKAPATAKMGSDVFKGKSFLSGIFNTTSRR